MPDQQSGFDVRSVERLIRILNVNVADVYGPVFWTVGMIGLRRLKTYPPSISDTYVRRGEAGGLKGSWGLDVDVRPQRITASMSNSRDYAPWVQSSEFQASVHRGRWDTDEEVLGDLVPHVEREAANALESEWVRRGAR